MANVDQFHLFLQVHLSILKLITNTIIWMKVYPIHHHLYSQSCVALQMSVAQVMKYGLYGWMMMLFAALLMKYYLHLMIHFNVAVQMKIIHAAPILTYIANQQKIPFAVILMNMYAMDNANI